jgi:hypothetical protein
MEKAESVEHHSLNIKNLQTTQPSDFKEIAPLNAGVVSLQFGTFAQKIITRTSSRAANHPCPSGNA